MGRLIIFMSILALFLVLIPMTESQWQPPSAPHPLCASQIALANYACARLPYAPALPIPPSKPLPRDESSGHRHRHRHRHSHSHSHEPMRPLSPSEENCCRWVQEVDSECVCKLLSHLPAFLERPRHNYTVTVGDSCGVTYYCEGRVEI